MAEDGERKGSWSALPDLLLWMIKDKLEFFDNMRFAAVCRGWRSASASYPKSLQTVGDGLPWIWQESSSSKGSSRDFISVTRGDKFSIDLPEFHHAAVLFSNCGWILLRIFNRSKSAPTSRRVPDSVLLINPLSRAKIKLPDILHTTVGYSGTFSVHEGYPHCVVLLKSVYGAKVTIGTAYPGDKVWTEHTYIGERTVFSGRRNLITVGKLVYLYDRCGRLIIYNMASDSWKVLSGSTNVLLKGYVTEHDGAILKIEHEMREDQNFGSYELFVYNDADTAWERLNNDAVRDTSWFLGDSKSCFSVKEKGLKVYFLCPLKDRFHLQSRDNVVVHDLLSGTTRTLHLPYPVRLSANWVDIG